MLEAVIQGKAKMSKLLDGAGKQPREDLVTSSIIGAVRFLSPAAQPQALSALIGHKIDTVIDLFLWPRFRAESRGWVEPDVVLHFEDATGPKYWLIEVKWGADLGFDQANREVEALRNAPCIRGTLEAAPRKLHGYTLLGFEPKHALAMDEFCAGQRLHVTKREWSDVTRDLHKMLSSKTLSPDLRAWAGMVHDFLQSVPQGIVLREWPQLAWPGDAQFSFSA